MPVADQRGIKESVVAIGCLDHPAPSHHAACASSLGKRTRLYAAAAKVKAQPTRSRPRNFVFSCPATVLIQPNASSIRLRMRRSEEHTSELQSRGQLVCRPL